VVTAVASGNGTGKTAQQALAAVTTTASNLFQTEAKFAFATTTGWRQRGRRRRQSTS